MSESKPQEHVFYDHVLVVGPDIGAVYVQAVIDAWRKMGVRYKVFGDGVNGIVDDDVLCRELAISTHSSTRIHYFGHGNVEEDTHDHFIHLHEEVQSTASILEAHKQIPGIRHVWSCYAGAAKEAVIPLVQQEGMPVVLHSAEDTTTLLAMNVQSIIDITAFCHQQRQAGIATTVYDDCALSLATSPETLIALTPGRAPFRASSPATHIPLQNVMPYIQYQHRGLREHFDGITVSFPLTPEQELEYHYRTLMLYISQGRPIDQTMIRREELNRMDIGGWSPLTNASSSNNMQAIRVLLALGVHMTPTIPLLAVCQHGDKELTKEVLRKLWFGYKGPQLMKAVSEAITVAEQHQQPYTGTMIREWVRDVFVDACAQGNRLLQKDILVANIWDRNALFYWACETGDLVMAEVLWQHGAHVNLVNPETESTPLMVACRAGNEKMVDWLLKKDANPNIADPLTGETALHIMAGKESTKIMELLIAAGADVNALDKSKKTPLHHACDMVNEDAVLQLLQHPDITVTRPDNRGNLPLHYAMEFAGSAIVNALLAKEHDISLKHPNNKGYTPLHCAAKYASATIIPLLVQYGAEVDAKQVDTQCTALHLAAKGRDVPTIRALLDARASIDVQDAKGRTPLWVASYTGDAELVAVLLDRGANTTIVDREGRSPAQIATKQEHNAIARDIQEYEARLAESPAVSRLAQERAAPKAPGGKAQ